MSLYSEREICVGCKHAVWFECEECLKQCKIHAEHRRNFILGTCAFKIIPPKKEDRHDSTRP